MTVTLFVRIKLRVIDPGARRECFRPVGIMGDIERFRKEDDTGVRDFLVARYGGVIGRSVDFTVYRPRSVRGISGVCPVKPNGYGYVTCVSRYVLTVLCDCDFIFNSVVIGRHCGRRTHKITSLS